MTFSQIIRRLHLYLALVLLPWFLVYGVSSIQFSHPGIYDSFYEDGIPTWTQLSAGPYDRPVPEGLSENELRILCTQIVDDLGIEVTSRLGFYKPGRQRLNISVFDFWNNTRVIYDIQNKQIKVEVKRFRWDHFLGGLHERDGFEQDSFLNDLWAVVVDLVSIGFILWVASGLYMWWQLKQARRWGFIALFGGISSFIGFIISL